MTLICCNDPMGPEREEILTQDETAPAARAAGRYLKKPR